MTSEILDGSSSQIRICIATVTYNAVSTLQRTLQSVAAQTYPHIVHLIVDGASKDGTVEMVQQYISDNEGHPHQIRFVSEPDSGLYDAMNKAIRLCSGDYLVFLNAGDCLHSADTIATIAAAASASARPAVLYGETDLVDNEGRFLSHRRLSVPHRLTSRSFLSGMLVCHQSFYVRTDLARQELYDLHYRFSADFDWCIRLLARAEREGEKFVNVNQILTDYLSEGLTTQNHRRSLMERFHIMRHHYGLFRTLLQHAWFVLRAVIK